MRPAVFLDRDGTINEEVEYLDNLSDLRLIPGADEGIALLNRAGFSVIVITNQSGVARGFFPEGFVQLVHSRLSEMLVRAGAHVEGWYYCPHHPEAGSPPYKKACDCRKPGTGMVSRAAKELSIDLGRSWLVGDSLSDLQTAWNAGMKSILVLTGHGRKTMESLAGHELERIDHVARDLFDACNWITGGLKK